MSKEKKSFFERLTGSEPENADYEGGENYGLANIGSEEKTYDALFIGIRRPRPELRRRIRAAIRKRVQRGLLRETRNLIQREIPEKRLAELGLDYGIAADYLKHRISREAMLAKLESATWRYAKRQETWFRKHRDIHWISNETEAKKLVKDFLSKESSEQQPKP